MRKQFKKIISAVLSAAMVLSLGTGTHQKIASADGDAVATADEAGFTAMIGFQTKDDYDCRDSFDDYTYGIGQEYLSWLKEQDASFDIDAHNAKQNGHNIYYNGNTAAVNAKTLELRNPEKVELNQDAVVTDAVMTADGEYTLKIENLNLNTNPDGSEEDPGEYFSMLYVAANIPYSESIQLKASSVKIDGEEVATDVVLPQKSDKGSSHVFAMVADSYNPDKYDSVAFGAGDQALTKIPTESIEITFSISGVDWSVAKYEPKEYDFANKPTPEPDTPLETTEPVEKKTISQPFDIGVVSNVNAALTTEVADPQAENGKLSSSVFGTAEYWNLAKTSLLDASGKASYGDHQQTFYETETGSVHITETGVYELSVTALGDSEDLTGDGAIWLPMIPNQMPKDYNLVGNTITVGDKAYAWGAKLYSDGGTSARLPVCNEWAKDSDKETANPVKSVIPVKKGDTVTFTFSVTPDAPEQPKPTVTPTEAPAAKSYNAYLGFQTDNWIFRDPWNKDTGLKSKDYDYKKQIMVSGGKPVNVTIKDAEIKQGVTKYDISISGLNLKTLKGGDKNGTLATKFNMLFISTDIPLTQKKVKCTNATLKIDGKVIKEYKTVPCKGDAEGYYQLMLANAYAPNDDTKDAAYPSGKELKVFPEKSIEVSFSISGVDFDKTTAGPAKGKTFSKGNFKYKVTKESQISSKTKKTSAGKVTVVGLSKKGKKAKKLTIPATVSQKKGKFKVTKLKAGALKAAKASSVTIGKNIKALPANVFKDCKNLKKLTLKAKLSSVNKKAFTGCSNKITVSGTGKKQNVKKIKKVYNKVK